MRINTVQTVLFRLLRDVHEQRRQVNSDKPSAGTKPHGESWLRLRTRRIIPSTRRGFRAMNEWLKAYYRAGGRTGLASRGVENRFFHLRPNELKTVTSESGHTQLKVYRGRVWITGSPAKGDILLDAGDRFWLRVDWPFVVQAIGEAEIALQ